jgi:hypothetical protein
VNAPVDRTTDIRFLDIPKAARADTQPLHVALVNDCGRKVMNPERTTGAQANC